MATAADPTTATMRMTVNSLFDSSDTVPMYRIVQHTRMATATTEERSSVQEQGWQTESQQIVTKLCRQIEHSVPLLHPANFIKSDQYFGARGFRNVGEFAPSQFLATNPSFITRIRNTYTHIPRKCERNWAVTVKIWLWTSLSQSRNSSDGRDDEAEDVNVVF